MGIHTESKVIETGIAKMYLDENGIVQMTIDYKRALTVDDIKELISSLIKICNGERASVLVKSVNYRLPSRETRIYSAGEESAKSIKAVAFMVSHPVTRIGANFFIKMNHPPFPFKTFTDEEEARLWLNEIRV